MCRGGRRTIAHPGACSRPTIGLDPGIGVEEALAVAVGEAVAVSSAGALVGREAEGLVGREAERRDRRCGPPLSEGRASTLVIEGEAGIGKTRLVQSIVDDARSRA